MELIVTANVHSFNMHVQLSSGNICSQFGMNRRLRIYFEYASGEGSDEMRSLVRAFTARICNKYRNLMNCHIWASTRENLYSEVCEQQRRRPACASAQSDQRLCFSHFEKYHIQTCYKQNFKFSS